MLKLFSVLAVLIVIYLSGFAQNIPGDRKPIPGTEKELLSALKISKPGIEQAESLLKLSAYYIYLPLEEKEDLDKAVSYATRAVKLSSSLKYSDGENEGMLLTGIAFLELGKADSGMIILETVLPDIIRTREQGKSFHQPEREARALRQMATIHQLQDNYTLAENELLEIIRIFGSNGFPDLHYTYERLTSLNSIKGNLDKALFYALEMMKSMKNTGDNATAGFFYDQLGFIYRNTGQFQKGIDCYEAAFDFFKKYRSNRLYEIKDAIAEAMTKMGRNEEAILMLRNTQKEYPPRNNYETRIIESALGNCYRALKQYELAEPHYLKMFEIQKKENYMDPWAYKNMGQFYAEWGKYDLARPYLETTLKLVKPNAHLHYLMYLVDSAAGDYISAMRHLMKNKALDDVAYYETKTRAIQEWNIKYETERKDQDIKFKEKNILLLNKQAELQQKDLEQVGLKLQFEKQSKEQSLKLIRSEAEKKDRDLLVKQQNIELLKQDGLLQQSRLQQAKTDRNMFIGGASMLLLLLALGYNRYRLKQRANKEINHKNLALQHLVDEKEWLLKEIHHRVKNNLQTVVSLLESQSAYLQDDALLAIQDSQNRVYAMSLIHQKLYQTEHVAAINIATYLPELVNYLRDSFNVKQDIHFHLQIMPLELDVSQAVPIGLIVNEAITNSIKYAFPGSKKGSEIIICMEPAANNQVELIISDNGIGLPAGFDNAGSRGLGLKLMNGLTEDIGGQFSIKTDKGTIISVNFMANTVLYKAEEINVSKRINQPV